MIKRKNTPLNYHNPAVLCGKNMQRLYKYRKQFGNNDYLG